MKKQIEAVQAFADRHSLLLAGGFYAFLYDAEIVDPEVTCDIHLVYELHRLFSYVFSFQFVSLLSIPSTVMFTAFTSMPGVASMSFFTFVCMS